MPPAVQAVLHVHRRHVDRAAEQSAADKVCTRCTYACLLHRFHTLHCLPLARLLVPFSGRMRRVYAAAQEAGEQQAPQEPQAAPPSVFGRHAEQWFPAMLDAVLGAAPPDKGVHYLLLDCCVTWLEWPALFPRPPEDAARRLTDHLVRGCRPPAALFEKMAVRTGQMVCGAPVCSRSCSIAACLDARLPCLSSSKARRGRAGRQSRWAGLLGAGSRSVHLRRCTGGRSGAAWGRTGARSLQQGGAGAAEQQEADPALRQPLGAGGAAAARGLPGLPRSQEAGRRRRAPAACARPGAVCRRRAAARRRRHRPEPRAAPRARRTFALCIICRCCSLRPRQGGCVPHAQACCTGGRRRSWRSRTRRGRWTRCCASCRPSRARPSWAWPAPRPVLPAAAAVAQRPLPALPVHLAHAWYNVTLCVTCERGRRGTDIPRPCHGA